MGRIALSFLLCTLAAHGQAVRLTSPHDGARPRSAYLAIEGEATPSAQVELLDGGAVAATIHADATGRFERVLHLPAGSHEIRARSSSSEILVHVEIGTFRAPGSPAPYEMLQTGDVILAHDLHSPQDALYQPVYTHCAIYAGPDANGGASLFEAVTEDDATPRGPVATVPLEESLVWRRADRVDVFRLPGGLAGEDRARMVSWAHRTAARGLPFGGAQLGDLYRVWLLWDSKNDQPRNPAEFEQLVGELRARKQANDSYDCATLVWHAYLDNTAAHIDIASPDRVPWGGAMLQESQRLAAILRPLVILPDSFALSGKLQRVPAE